MVSTAGSPGTGVGTELNKQAMVRIPSGFLDDVEVAALQDSHVSGSVELLGGQGELLQARDADHATDGERIGPALGLNVDDGGQKAAGIADGLRVERKETEGPGRPRSVGRRPRGRRGKG